MIHNLRSALDHLATALAPNKPRWDKAFPIVEKRLWDKDAAGNFTVKDENARERFEKNIAGMDPEAIALIEAMQPGRQHGSPEKVVTHFDVHSPR